MLSPLLPGLSHQMTLFLTSLRKSKSLHKYALKWLPLLPCKCILLVPSYLLLGYLHRRGRFLLKRDNLPTLAFVFFWPCHQACGISDLSCWSGLEPTPPAVETQSINHWATREVPLYSSFLSCPITPLFPIIAYSINSFFSKYLLNIQFFFCTTLPPPSSEKSIVFLEKFFCLLSNQVAQHHLPCSHIISYAGHSWFSRKSSYINPGNKLRVSPQKPEHSFTGAMLWKNIKALLSERLIKFVCCYKQGRERKT